MPAAGTKKVTVTIVGSAGEETAEVVKRLALQARELGLRELRSLKLEDEYWRVADSVRVFVWSAVAS